MEISSILERPFTHIRISAAIAAASIMSLSFMTVVNPEYRTLHDHLQIPQVPQGTACAFAVILIAICWDDPRSHAACGAAFSAAGAAVCALSTYASTISNHIETSSIVIGSYSSLWLLSGAMLGNAVTLTITKYRRTETDRRSYYRSLLHPVPLFISIAIGALLAALCATPSNNLPWTTSSFIAASSTWIIVGLMATSISALSPVGTVVCLITLACYRNDPEDVSGIALRTTIPIAIMMLTAAAAPFIPARTTMSQRNNEGDS